MTNWTAREASAAIISCQSFLVRKHVVIAGRDTWPTGSACRLVEDWSTTVKRFKHFVCTSRRGANSGRSAEFPWLVYRPWLRAQALLRALNDVRTRAPRATPSHLPHHRRRSLWRTCYRHCIESTAFSHTLDQKIAWWASSWHFHNSAPDARNGQPHGFLVHFVQSLLYRRCRHSADVLPA
ncbi:hypothetical protein MRX96_021863 [Rhipicephalus microplus]